MGISVQFGGFGAVAKQNDICHAVYRTNFSKKLSEDKPMPTQLQQTISNYFTAANKHDVAAMLATFAEGASVMDEGRERNGLAEIEQWINETLVNTDIKKEVLSAQENATGTDVISRLTGTFPGSPADLRFAFRMTGEKISRLEITYANGDR